MTPTQKTREQIEKIVLAMAVGVIKIEPDEDDNADLTPVVEPAVNQLTDLFTQALTALLEAMPEKIENSPSRIIGELMFNPEYVSGWNNYHDQVTAIIEGQLKGGKK